MKWVIAFESREGKGLPNQLAPEKHRPSSAGLLGKVLSEFGTMYDFWTGQDLFLCSLGLENWMLPVPLLKPLEQKFSGLWFFPFNIKYSVVLLLKNINTI